MACVHSSGVKPQYSGAQKFYAEKAARERTLAAPLRTNSLLERYLIALTKLSHSVPGAMQEYQTFQRAVHWTEDSIIPITAPYWCELIGRLQIRLFISLNH